MRAFGGTILHEITHAKTSFDDVTREFESVLTDLLGAASAAAVASASKRKGILSRLQS